MKPIDQLKNELFSCIGNEYLIIGDYKGTNRNTIFYHTVCKNTFLKTPHNFFLLVKDVPIVLHQLLVKKEYLIILKVIK